MVDTIEKRIDVPAGAEWSEKRKEYVPAKPIAPETKEEDINAIDLEKAYDQIEWKTAKPNDKQENNQLPTSTQDAIKQLNRPEAEKWIAQSYANIENTIKNSKNEKWIPGFLGKIMNKILG